MYPFKIIYSTKEEKEKHKDEIYGYANDLSEIKNFTGILFILRLALLKKCINSISKKKRLEINFFFVLFNSLPHFL